MSCSLGGGGHFSAFLVFNLLIPVCSVSAYDFAPNWFFPSVLLRTSSPESEKAAPSTVKAANGLAGVRVG